MGAPCELSGLCAFVAFHAFFEPEAEFVHGAGAVADAVFLEVAQFGKGFLMAQGEKKGVVAESVGAAGHGGDDAFAAAFEDVGNLVRADQNQAADEPRRALGRGRQHHSGELAGCLSLVAPAKRSDYRTKRTELLPFFSQ